MLCIGTAAQDIFLEGEVFKPLKDKGVFYEHIKLGEKFYVDEATFSTGGNAANAAITFARQHLETKFVGVLGDDPAGQVILKTLDLEHVDTSLVITDQSLRSSFSTILLAPTGERTILNYFGTAKLKTEHINIQNLQADWLYVSSVGSMSLLNKIMKASREQGVKVAFNPSSFELKHVQECADLLEYVNVFAVNKEEAELFVDGKSTKDLAKNLARSVDYVIVSDGPKGSVASDGKVLVAAGMYDDVKVVDRTGAGDAFSSGFVSQIALGKNLEEAVIFASANSTSVVSKIGANAGIIKGSPKLHEMPIKVTPL